MRCVRTLIGIVAAKPDESAEAEFPNGVRLLWLASQAEVRDFLVQLY